MRMLIARIYHPLAIIRYLQTTHIDVDTISKNNYPPMRMRIYVGYIFTSFVRCVVFSCNI
jgi:hypothetical protein